MGAPGMIRRWSGRTILRRQEVDRQQHVTGCERTYGMGQSGGKCEQVTGRQLATLVIDHHFQPAREDVDGHRSLGPVLLHLAVDLEREKDDRHRAMADNRHLPVASDGSMRLGAEAGGDRGQASGLNRRRESVIRMLAESLRGTHIGATGKKGGWLPRSCRLALLPGDLHPITRSYRPPEQGEQVVGGTTVFGQQVNGTAVNEVVGSLRAVVVVRRSAGHPWPLLAGRDVRLRHPVEQLAGLKVEKATQFVEGFGTLSSVPR